MARVIPSPSMITHGLNFKPTSESLWFALVTVLAITTKAGDSDPDWGEKSGFEYMVKKIWDNFAEIGPAIKAVEEGFWLIVLIATLGLGVWWVWL